MARAHLYYGHVGKTTSEWQTPERVEIFLSKIRRAIPGAELQLAVLRKIAELWCENPSVILDLGCGDGILGRLLMSIFPSARAVFVDFSKPMLDALRAQLKGGGRTSVVEADFGSADWSDSVKGFGPFDIVVSGFAIHHQPDWRKRELYSEIYAMLPAGGVFLNLEHVAPRGPAGAELFDEFFVDRLHESHSRSEPGTAREAVAREYYSRPEKEENILAPVEDQCRWLEEIGFADVDCFLKVFDLALFGGRKLEGHRGASI